MIAGTVRSGRGKASQAMQGDKLIERQHVANAVLVPGTLNVAVDDLQGALVALGEPARLSETDSRHGALRWWPVWVHLRSGRNVSAWVVRHAWGTAPYLEVVSHVHFRRIGVADGDALDLSRRQHVDGPMEQDPEPPKGRRQYQDQWAQGRAVSRGYRECERRYGAIRAALQHVPRPFTVLDLGCDRAYFSLRLAEDFGAICTAVNREPVVVESVAMNPGASVTPLVRAIDGPADLAELGTFDVVLALSILHHFPHVWPAMIEQMERMARYAVAIEPPAPGEPVQVRDGDTFRGLPEEVARRGTRIGEGPTVFGRNGRRGIYRIDTNKVP